MKHPITINSIGKTKNGPNGRLGATRWIRTGYADWSLLIFNGQNWVLAELGR